MAPNEMVRLGASSPKKEDDFGWVGCWCRTSRILDAEAAKVSPGPLWNDVAG